MNGWQVFERICEWLWIACGIGFFVTVGYLVATVLHFKTAVMGNAKRLYERPVNSVKSLIATGKAIAQQEQVRVKHMAGSVKVAAGDVKEAATEIKDAAQTVHPSEIKSALASVQSAFQFLSVASQFMKSASKQDASASKP